MYMMVKLNKDGNQWKMKDIVLLMFLFGWLPQKLLDEDDVKVAADAMKELEMFMPSVSGTDSKSSKSR